MEANHHEKLADGGAEIDSRISTDQARDTAAIFGQFMTTPDVLFPCGSEVFVVPDLERMIEPVLENAVVFLLNPSSQVATRDVRGAQPPVLFDRCRFDTPPQPQVSHMAEGWSEDIWLLGRCV